MNNTSCKMTYVNCCTFSIAHCSLVPVFNCFHCKFSFNICLLKDRPLKPIWSPLHLDCLKSPFTPSERERESENFLWHLSLILLSFSLSLPLSLGVNEHLHYNVITCQGHYLTSHKLLCLLEIPEMNGDGFESQNLVKCTNAYSWMTRKTCQIIVTVFGEPERPRSLL